MVHRETLLFWNLQNMFDCLPDPTKLDAAFLPQGHPKKIQAAADPRLSPEQQAEILLSNWTEPHYRLKLDQLRRYLQAIAPRLPSFFSFAEIDNAQTLQDLMAPLKCTQSMITNCPDERGINVAAAVARHSKINLKVKIEHDVSALCRKPTRNILELRCEIGAYEFAIFINHWPSQASPAQERRLVAERLAEIVHASRQSTGSPYVIVMGDFNVLERDDPNPFFPLLDEKSGLGLLDLHYKHLQFLRAAARWEEMSLQPIGSYFHAPKMQWNLLDRVFLSKDFFSNETPLRVDLDSYRIQALPTLMADRAYAAGLHAGSLIKNIPFSYSLTSLDPETAGFSDHWPITFDLLT